MTVPLIPCTYCGNILHRHDVVYTDRSKPEGAYYYHLACWNEHRANLKRELDALERKVNAARDIGGMP